ncbi:MAG: beta/gamma crystallin-related protein [Rubrivivax sp.]
MKTALKTLLAAAVAAAAAPVLAQATLYEHEGFRGQAISADRRITDLSRMGFNDRASSLVIDGQRWEVCADAAFSGRCVVLGPGRYPSLGAMGLNDRVSSLRVVDVNARADDRYGDRREDFHRRRGERLYQAQVVAVRAVVGPPEQRCWVERQQVVEERRPNVPGAVVGALIGGVLGHQIGGGSGRDLATAGGVVAGAAVGANVNRDDRVASRDVQRCTQVRGPQRPEYWDVTYVFRGQQHHMQTTAPPGATVTVNGRGEPRVG